MSDTTKDAGLDITRAEFERACTLLPPEFVWGLPVTPRLVLDVAEATLLSASKPAAPNWLTDDEARIQDYAEQHMLTLEEAVDALAASPAAPAQSAEPMAGELEAFEVWFKTSGFWNNAITEKAWRAACAWMRETNAAACDSIVEQSKNSLFRSGAKICAGHIRDGAPEQCDVPPDGWTCSRPKGHTGPCAATQTAVVLDDERAAFIVHWCKDVPEAYREDAKRNVRAHLHEGTASDRLADAWEAWQASRRAALEECSTVCDEIANDRWSLYKGRAPYMGSESGRADPYVEGESDGAEKCAAAIRALTSP